MPESKAGHHVDGLRFKRLKRDEWELTTEDAFVGDENGSEVLDIRGVTLKRNGVYLPIDPHQRIVNPPLKHRGRDVAPMTMLLEVLKTQVRS